MTAQLGEQVGTIFAAHLQMLQDPRLRRDSRGGDPRAELTRPNSRSTRRWGRYAKRLRESPNPVLAERAHDIVDLERCLLRHLTGRPQDELANLTSPVVLVAHNLTPSETAKLKPQFVLGFVTEIGGAGGHTAIVAKGLEIPAVVGVGRFLARSLRRRAS